MVAVVARWWWVVLNSVYYLNASGVSAHDKRDVIMFECYASEKKWYGRSFTRFFLGKFGDSNLTERNSRRSGAGVFGVDCTSDGSDLKRPASFGYSRRIGCGVPPGDQIPIQIQIYEEKKTKIFRFIIYIKITMRKGML